MTNERPLTALGVDALPDATVSVAAAPFPTSSPLIGLGGDRDLFAASDVVREVLLASRQDPSGDASGRGQQRAIAVMTAEKFEATHRLTGTLIGKRGSFAIVDDRWLRVGDTLDDCELTSITGTGAKFQCPSDVASLSVIEN